MVAFVSVLAEVEKCSEEAGRSFIPLRGGMMEPFLLLNVNRASPARVIAAYQCVQADQTIDAVSDSFPRLLSEAKGSTQALQALRRRLAWRLHPDRGIGSSVPASLSLSEINAAIDEALASCSTSGRRE